MEVGKEYKCKGKIKSFFTGEDIEVKSFTLIKGTSLRSPIDIIDFGKGSIEFADPNEVTDKYDKAAIINEADEFVLYNTYNKKLYDKFFKSINFNFSKSGE